MAVLKNNLRKICIYHFFLHIFAMYILSIFLITTNFMFNLILMLYVMRKVPFVQTVIRFYDVYNNFYCERYVCRSFLSYTQIRHLSDDMLDNLPDNRIDWSSFELKMRFVNLLVPAKNV